jgi:hypothetical protein
MKVIIYTLHPGLCDIKKSAFNSTKHKRITSFFSIRTPKIYVCIMDTHFERTEDRILTFIMVLFDTGTNFPAVSVNPLLAVAMMKARQRWNGTGVPTQSHPQAASLTLSAWRIH